MKNKLLLLFLSLLLVGCQKSTPSESINNSESISESVSESSSIEQVKEIADYITKSNNDDGVAWYLENFCMEEF